MTGEIKGLSAVSVKTSDLLTKIKTNREQHKTDFESLTVGYQEKLLAVLRDAIAAAEKSDEAFTALHSRDYVTLPPKPQNHTKDYDRVIAMLEMSIDETLELPAHEFARYALDEWDWSQAFNSTKAMYSNTR